MNKSTLTLHTAVEWRLERILVNLPLHTKQKIHRNQGCLPALRSDSSPKIQRWFPCIPRPSTTMYTPYKAHPHLGRELMLRWSPNPCVKYKTHFELRSHKYFTRIHVVSCRHAKTPPLIILQCTYGVKINKKSINLFYNAVEERGAQHPEHSEE